MTKQVLDQALLDSLASLANANLGEWPAASFELLADSGLLANGIPVEFGGTGDVFSMTPVYIELAAADLTTCFVLTQQNSAVSRLVASGNAEAQSLWLPQIATGAAFATVGISHLSTSRQHVSKPAVSAASTDNGYSLNGVVPWSTSATRADVVVVGATLEDSREILAAVDTRDIGFVPGDPVEMLALTESETGQIELHDVQVDDIAVIAGPVAGVMKTGAGGAGSLTTSALAVGLSQRCVELLKQESAGRDDVAQSAERLEDELNAIRADILAAEDARPSAENVRTRANSLSLRASQALMTACKGAGFLKGHPAERAVREAMFFLVWSCPRPVASAAMNEFVCRPFCD